MATRTARKGFVAEPEDPRAVRKAHKARRAAWPLAHAADDWVVEGKALPRAEGVPPALVAAYRLHWRVPRAVLLAWWRSGGRGGAGAGAGAGAAAAGGAGKDDDADDDDDEAVAAAAAAVTELVDAVLPDVVADLGPLIGRGLLLGVASLHHRERTGQPSEEWTNFERKEVFPAVIRSLRTRGLPTLGTDTELLLAMEVHGPLRVKQRE